jgi:hypothetical protein
MTSRRVSGIFAVVFAGLLCWAASGCGHDETAAALEKYRKIDEGMTAEQVEAILGPPSEDSNDPVLLALQKEMKLPESAKWKKWKVAGKDPEVYIGLAFDEGKVVARMRKGF